MQEFLRNGRRHNASSTRSGNQTHDSRPTFPRNLHQDYFPKPPDDDVKNPPNLARDSVRTSELISPITLSNGYDGELGERDGSSNCRRHFLRTLDAQAEMPISIADRDERLEARALSGASLLLNGHDLENFVFESAAEKEIDDLGFLNRQSNKRLIT